MLSHHRPCIAIVVRVEVSAALADCALAAEWLARAEAAIAAAAAGIVTRAGTWVGVRTMDGHQWMEKARTQLEYGSNWKVDTPADDVHRYRVEGRFHDDCCVGCLVDCHVDCFVDSAPVCSALLVQ